MKPLFPPDFEALERSGIGKIAVQGLGMKDVYPLWFGEGSEPTPKQQKLAAVKTVRWPSAARRAIAFSPVL